MLNSFINRNLIKYTIKSINMQNRWLTTSLNNKNDNYLNKTNFTDNKIEVYDSSISILEKLKYPIPSYITEEIKVLERKKNNIENKITEVKERLIQLKFNLELRKEKTNFPALIYLIEKEYKSDIEEFLLLKEKYEVELLEINQEIKKLLEDESYDFYILKNSVVQDTRKLEKPSKKENKESKTCFMVNFSDLVPNHYSRNDESMGNKKLKGLRSKARLEYTDYKASENKTTKYLVNVSVVYLSEEDLLESNIWFDNNLDLTLKTLSNIIEKCGYKKIWIIDDCYRNNIRADKISYGNKDIILQGCSLKSLLSILDLKLNKNIPLGYTDEEIEDLKKDLINIKLSNVNSDLKNNLFIFRGYTWGIINNMFKHYNINLSSGLKRSSYLMDSLDYKLSFLIGELFGYKKGYKKIVVSKNRTDKSLIKKSNIESNLILSLNKNKVLPLCLLNEIKIDENKTLDKFDPKLTYFIIYLLGLRFKNFILMKNKESLELKFKEEYLGSIVFNEKEKEINALLEGKELKKFKYKLNFPAFKREDKNIKKNNLNSDEKFADKNNSKCEVNNLNKDSSISNITNNNLRQSVKKFYSRPINIKWNRLYHSNCRNKEYETKVIYKNKKIGFLNFSLNRFSSIQDNICKQKRYHSNIINKCNINKRNILFQDIKNIIKNNPTNESTQKKIEKYLYNLELYENTHDDNSHNKTLKIYELIGSLNKELKELILDSIKTLNSIINNYKNRNLQNKNLSQIEKVRYWLSEMLIEIKSDYIIGLMIWNLLKLMNHVGQDEINTVKIADDIGKNISQYYFYILYNKSKSNKETDYSFNEWKEEEENKKLLDTYDNTFINLLGFALIEWLNEAELITIVTEKSLIENNRQINILKMSDKVKKVVGKRIPLNLPTRIPMIVKPKPYERIKKQNGKEVEILGGYLLNGELITDEIIITNWRSKYNSEILKHKEIYSVINNISSVAYKINKNVLNFIREFDVIYNLTKVNSTHPLEEKLNNNEKLKKYEKIELERFISKKLVDEYILALADLFEDVSEFFIPVRMDYRGRIYCHSNYLNYQGTELSKSLLLFRNGEKIIKTDLNSIKYLKIYGANCFGNKLDKKSFNERVKWIDDNVEEIINFKNGNLIKKADSKLLFISFCFEYNRWLECLKDSNSTHFETYLPIQLDATCNGFQHLSFLSYDYKLAEHLNLMESNEDDTPEDFYTFISTLLHGYFNNELQKKNLLQKDKESLERLLNINIHRNIVKKAIMTIPYNASSVQTIEYLRESFELDTEFNEEYKDVNLEGKKNNWYKNISDPTFKLRFNDFIFIYKGIKNIINTVFPSLKILINYLKEVASICSILNISIPWTLPSGLKAVQSYMQIVDVRIRPFSYTKLTFNLKIANSNKLDKKKQITALMPNLIHSLDAASLSLLMSKFFNSNHSKIKNIYAIHDCFASTANNMKFIICNLKLIYIAIYSDVKYINQFNKDILEHIKLHIGDSFDENSLTITIDQIEEGEFKKKIVLNFPDISKIFNNSYDISLVKKSSYILI